MSEELPLGNNHHYREIDKDQVIEDLRKEIAELKAKQQLKNSNYPVFGLTLVSVSFEETDEKYPYRLRLQWSSTKDPLSVRVGESQWKALAAAGIGVGEKVDFMLFPPNTTKP